MKIEELWGKKDNDIKEITAKQENIKFVIWAYNALCTADVIL